MRNLDHTHSVTKAVEAARAGFDAVVIDLSALPFDQNVSRTKETIEAVKAIDPEILAEGEIGDIGTGSEIHESVHDDFRNLTTPEEARQFVDSTAIDVLAPAVGNTHGMLEELVPRRHQKAKVKLAQHIKELVVTPKQRDGEWVYEVTGG